MRGRVVLLLVILVVAGCTRKEDTVEPTPEPVRSEPVSSTPEPTPEATPSPTPTPSATPSPTPEAPPTPTPTATPTPPTNDTGNATGQGNASAPTLKRFSKVFDLTINSAPLLGTPTGAPESDCVRLYASNTTRIPAGNATLTWSALAPTSTSMVLEMRVEPAWNATRVNGTSPLNLPIGNISLLPIAQPPPGFAGQSGNTIASGWFKASLASGGTPAVQQTLQLNVTFDYESGGGIDTDIGGCSRPGLN